MVFSKTLNIHGNIGNKKRQTTRSAAFCRIPSVKLNFFVREYIKQKFSVLNLPYSELSI